MNKIVLLIIIILILIIIALSFLLKTFKTSPKDQSQPLPTNYPISTTAPSFAPLPTITPTDEAEFKVVDVIPQANPSEKSLPVQQIAVYFSKEISPSDVEITTSPETKVQVLSKPGYNNMIIISPEDFWKLGLTTITITTSTRSVAGDNLVEEYTYQINSGIENPGL